MESPQLPWTGERLVPHLSGDIVLEHLHRYAIAAELAADRDVLDIACGEGFGSHLIALRARSVVGVDIAPEVVRHAGAKYNRPNLSFLDGSGTAIPLADASVDLVVSFETLEHLVEHEIFLDEVRRVLRPAGIFIVSTPDKRIYTQQLGNRNQFHPRELDTEEFAALLARNFAHTAMLNQRVCLGSFIAPLYPSVTMEVGTHRGDWAGIEFTPGVAEGIYLLAICSNGPLPTLRAGLFEFGHAEADTFLPPLAVERRVALQTEAALTETQAKLTEACRYREWAQSRLQEQETESKRSQEQLVQMRSERNGLEKQLEEARTDREAAVEYLRAKEAESVRKSEEYAEERRRIATLLAAPQVRRVAATGLVREALQRLAALVPTSCRLGLHVRRRQIARSGFFSGAWYLKHNPDVNNAGMDPILHYFLCGAREGRDPGPDFSTRWYLEEYPDVAASSINPLLHFIWYGRSESRLPRPPG